MRGKNKMSKIDYNVEYKVLVENQLKFIKGYLENKYVPMFKDLVGQEVLNKDMSIKKNISKKLDLDKKIKEDIEYFNSELLPYNDGKINVRLILMTNEYDIYFWFDICHRGGGFDLEDKPYWCSYDSDYAYFCDIRDRVITNVKTPAIYFEYDVFEVKQAIEKIKQLEKEISETRRKIPVRMRDKINLYN